jgi:hypothetical protein
VGLSRNLIARDRRSEWQQRQLSRAFKELTKSRLSGLVFVCIPARSSDQIQRTSGLRCYGKVGERRDIFAYHVVLLHQGDLCGRKRRTGQ